MTRHLRRIVLPALLGLWGVCFLLHVDALLRFPPHWLPVVLEGADAPHAAPRVRGFWSRADAAVGDVHAGDRLLRVEATTLEGATALEASARIHAAAQGRDRLRVEVERDAQRGQTGPDAQHVEATLALRPVPRPWRLSLLSAALVAVGVLAWRRAPASPVVASFLAACVVYALHWGYFWGGGSPARNLAAFGVFALGPALGLPLFLRTLLAFPEDAAWRGAAPRLAPWLLAPVGLGAATVAFGGPLPIAWGRPLWLGGSVAAALAAVALLAVQWRRTGPLGRRQIKWVLLGGMVAAVPPALAGVAALLRPALWPWYELSLLSLLALPCGLFVALVRDHLFDVDRLLTAAASFTVLSIALLAGVIGLVPTLAHAAQPVLDPAVSQPALALAAAAALLAARSRVEPWLERRLFPERERLLAGAERLRRQLEEAEKPAELLGRLAEGLWELLEPDSLVLYARAEQAFAPVFERGPAVAPSFALEGPVASGLAEHFRVVDRGALAVGAARDAEWAALASMGVALLLPVRRDDLLDAFVCLGSKRSGDAYGAGDLAHLQAVADKAADALCRFDLVQLQRAQDAMCQRLRRYVPGAVAEHLASGRELPSEEREVTVMFVDLRGYTGLSERRAAEQVFSFVSRYTEAVSKIVVRHGGTVVDFQGDGLMAVFGAPEPLPDKERAAVCAAAEVVEAVRALPLSSEEAARADLGVGVATGPAFVGSLRAADRSIFGVLGDTTNLAARCQALTRELEAHIVIDARTRRAAARETADYVACLRVAIRGRRRREDLYLRPAEPASA